MYGPAPQHCRLVKARLHTHTDTYAYGYGASVDSIFNSGLDARTARDTGILYNAKMCVYINKYKTYRADVRVCNQHQLEVFGNIQIHVNAH